jgi:hypothetical protein
MARNRSGSMMGSGTMDRPEGGGLMMAVGKLTPAERLELMKIIRTYLESKGVTVGNPPPGIDVMSWSFGASNAGSMSTGG